MRCRIVKWSSLSCLLIVATIRFSTSTAVYPKNDDLGNISSRQSNHSSTATTLVSDPTNHSNLKRRWSNTYGTSRVEPRLFFPVLATPRPSSSYGLHFKGYRPTKAPPIGYPAPKPPLPPYRPQPSRPTRPSHNYGPPKPTGYPASSNYQQLQEIYITYPPATSVTYPQTSGNNNPGGSYGSGNPSSYQSTPATTGAGTNYLSTSPPSKPNYEVPISIPNPSYVTSKPNYVSTSSTPYPNPTYPVSSGQTTYPGYPASPNSSGGGSYTPYIPPHNPHYPALQSASNYPNYPASSGGSYPASSSVGASHLPIFVFIPKPGYFHVDHNSKPGNYHKPSDPLHYYPTTRPPVTPIPQYYPTAKPTKPLQPTGVYPPAKPPSTAYGLPKPQRPTQQHYPPSQSGAYGSENSKHNYHYNSPTNTKSDVHFNAQTNNYHFLTTRKPSDLQHQPVSTHYKPNLLAAQVHPSVFQRGNIQRPVDEPSYSTVISDFIPLPETIIGLQNTGQTHLGSNQNQSWVIGAESSQIVSITEYPSVVNNAPSYQDEFRVPIHSGYRKTPLNDCGGSWVVLQHPTGKFVDPTQVQIEPIYPQSESSHQFNPKLNDQLFRSPNEGGISYAPLSSGINESIHWVPGSISNDDDINKPYIPDFLIFATTPNPELVSTTEVTDDAGEWKKPNSLISSFSFAPSRTVPSDRTTPSFATGLSTFRNGITITSADDTSSAENSTVISSLDAINLRDPKNSFDFEDSGIKNPSPFLIDISSPFNDENDSKEAKSLSLVSDNNVATRDSLSSIEETDKLSRNLRSANLRTISSLINRAGIASLFHDKEYTLLAPSNAAFNKISSTQRKRWANRPDSLREMLLHHVIPSHFNSTSFENEATPASLAGSHHLRINIYNATENRDTITTVNGARVLTTDLRLGKLLVHVVDRVLLPGNFPSQTILEILNDGGRFQSLQASLLGPALTKVLSSDSPLSVFVPTTEAFLSVSQDEQRLFLNNETAFHNLLWYHIVPGTYYSEGLEDGQLLSTLHNVGRLRVDVLRQNRKSKLARINGVANVIESDVSASNGVVHFIDRILTDILLF